MDPYVVSGGDAGLTKTSKSQQTTPSNHLMDGLDLVQVVVRREHSSFSDSQLDFECSNSLPSLGRDTKSKARATRQRKTKSVYGACQNFQFGPKASLLRTQDTFESILDPCNLMLMWDRKPKSVLIIKKIWDDLVDGAFVELAEWLLEEQKMEVLIEQKVMEDPCIVNQPPFAHIRNSLSTFIEGKDNLTGRVDLIICLGGDGTLLYASTLFQGSVPPVMAFHLGSLGFLSPFEFADYKERVTRVLRGSEEICLMLRTRLQCNIVRERDKISKTTTTDKPVESKPHILALNEVVVDRGSTPYLCQLDLYIENRQVTVVQGDGLIISTPTGSTAYAAAAGASMVHPNVPAIIIAPICPHSLSFRPIVVPASVEIKIMVSPEARNDAWVSFDGRNRQQLSKADVLVISTSKYPLPSICNNDPTTDWFESLGGCLHWNIRKTQLPIRTSVSSSDIRSGSDSADSNGGGR